MSSSEFDWGGITPVVKSLKVGAIEPGMEAEPAVIELSSSGLGYASGGSVTQTGSLTTGVTLHALTGRITTVSATTGAGAESTFTVTNSKVSSTDVVVVTATYSGTGTPMVFCSNVSSGSFNITITNLHATAALNASLNINFVVLKGTI